ncbi:TPA: sigma-70 family RNA polymerase sigma factor [Stenotrophomonas maltophilia]
MKTAIDSSREHGPLEAMYLSHGRWLTAWLRQRMADRHEAADLVQDTFARLCHRARELEQVSEPRAYLTVVAKRLLINRYQRQALEQAYLSSLRERPESYAPSPEERAMVLETLLELDRMLDGLPPKVRRAFLLSQLDGMSYAQIAASLKVSIRTVTRYMSDAYAQCLRLVLSTDQ